jgi:hypothetical protein
MHLHSYNDLDVSIRSVVYYGRTFAVVGAGVTVRPCGSTPAEGSREDRSAFRE